MNVGLGITGPRASCPWLRTPHWVRPVGNCKSWRWQLYVKSGDVIQPSRGDGSIVPVCPHLYAAGSGESDGLAKRFDIIALSGMFRLMPLGGIGLWNHLA